MRKPDPGAINEGDISEMARESGLPPPPEYIDKLVEKAMQIDKEKALAKEQAKAKAKAREKSKGKDKGRDMLDDD
ncbi:MAG TPA: hypothetical protein PKI32_03100 [Opitutales bacterium]|nr:hypothetical protein [Opitutales bacterium]